MELWELYDKNGRNTGILYMRGRPIPDGYYHLVVFLWVFTGDHQLMLLRKESHKDPTWKLPCASVLQGETSFDTLHRLYYQTTGYTSDHLHFFHRTIKDSALYDHYIIKEEKELKKNDLYEFCLLHRSDFEHYIEQRFIDKPVVYLYRLFEREWDTVFK